MTIREIAEQVLAGMPATRAQAEWLSERESSELPELFAFASRLREKHFGNAVRCCSIVSAKTGACPEDCAFCSQSARYDTPVKGCTVIDDQAILKAGAEAAERGADSFGIVTSGRGPSDRDVERWGAVAGRIRRDVGIRACASCGILREEQAARLAELGVERYNHNLQTSRRFFPSIITTHTYDERLATLRALKRAGISVCSGALFGMGETWIDRVDLAMTLQEIEPDVVPLNFLIGIDGTPLANARPLPPMECLHIIAVYRFCLPKAEIKIAGGREVHLRDLQSWIFLAGANSFLIGNYLTTCGRDAEADRQMVRDLGLRLEEGGGRPSGRATAIAHA